jgi:hypothetical protein
MSGADEPIFVRIAAYREFDLVPTVRDLLDQAAAPERLRIGICWQHAPDESLGDLASDPRLDVIDVDHRESRGACWARNHLQQRWDGEAFTLGLDGHHRFVPGWDRLLVDHLRGLQDEGVAKPILTGYAPSYDPFDDPAGRDPRVWLTGFDRFEERGVVFMRPFVPDEAPTTPVPARFWSGHFNFTVGEWNAEVPIDPEAYFHSEEIVLTGRSFTHGYDHYLPPQTILWHEYSRRERTTHWDEHPEWRDHDAATVGTYRRMFGVDGEQPLPDGYAYGFGTERTLADYERFAGLDFATRGVQRGTLANDVPPNADDDEWLHTRSLTLVVPRRVLEGADHCVVSLNAEDGTELHRRDLDEAAVRRLLERQEFPLVQLDVEAVTAQPPASWTVRPHHASSGWLDPITELCDGSRRG